MDGRAGPPVQRVQNAQEDRQPHSDRRECHVEHRRGGELPARKIEQAQDSSLAPHGSRLKPVVIAAGARTSHQALIPAGTSATSITAATNQWSPTTNVLN